MSMLSDYLMKMLWDEYSQLWALSVMRTFSDIMMLSMLWQENDNHYPIHCTSSWLMAGQGSDYDFSCHCWTGGLGIFLVTGAWCVLCCVQLSAFLSKLAPRLPLTPVHCSAHCRAADSDGENMQQPDKTNLFTIFSPAPSFLLIIQSWGSEFSKLSDRRPACSRVWAELERKARGAVDDATVSVVSWLLDSNLGIRHLKFSRQQKYAGGLPPCRCSQDLTLG